MAKIHPFSIPNGDTIKEDIEQLIGRQTFSSVVRDALRLYHAKLKGDSERPCPLPTPGYFEKFVHDIKNKKKLEEIQREAQQLSNIAKRELDWVKGRVVDES